MWVELQRPLLLAALAALIGGNLFFLCRKYPAHGIKTRLSRALHAATALLCALALCGASVLGPSRERASFLLLDASASASSGQGEMLSMAKAALAAAPEGQKTGVIAFGKDAMVETPLSAAPAFSGLTARVNPDGTDLTNALSLAGALLPSDAAGAVAVITDGLVDAATADALAARGIPVHILRLSRAAKTDAQVSRVTVPSLAYQGQSFPVTVTVDSTREGNATLVLWANRTPAATQEVTLRKGENTFTFTDTAAASGVTAYEAQVLLPGDETGANNRLGAYMTVTGAPTVLLVAGKTGAADEMQKLLAAAGMGSEICPPDALPENAAALRAYHAVVLGNVDADTLTIAQIEALREAVRTLGRGLCVLGGDQSYALGGYRGSELETMLPVTMDVKSTLDMPSLALVLALDKSGSMTEGKYGVTRLEVAKEAAARSAEVLLPTDQIGVIAFDDAAQWVVSLQSAADLAAIQDKIGAIRPGGGTAFYSPLVAAFNALSQAQAARKHVIFLTDGEPGDAGFEGVVQRMAEQGITLTTVAVGSGANGTLLQTLAELGGGRAWAANEFDNVPKIFTKETMLLSGSYVQNRVFTPVVTENSALTDFPGFPTLSGYLGVTERPEATVSLESDREDPILAWWQYGAGKTLCWMSDATGGWSGQFLSWENAAAFFGGMVSQVLPRQNQAGKMETAGGVLRYTAPDAREEGEARAAVLLPDGKKTTLTLVPVSPGVYEAPLPQGDPGAYAVTVEYRVGGETAATLEGGAVVSYSREYDLRLQPGDALERLAAQTGGRIVTDPQALFSIVSAPARARKDLTAALCALALFLFILDVAQRRLNWERLLARPARETPAAPAPQAPAKKRPAPADGREQGQVAEELWQTLKKRKRL